MLCIVGDPVDAVPLGKWRYNNFYSEGEPCYVHVMYLSLQVEVKQWRGSSEGDMGKVTHCLLSIGDDPRIN